MFVHVAKNAAPTAIAVMGLQLGYLLGGSILIETVFSWPGTGFLLNSAIFQRDLPLLQGTILVLALFFVFLNLVVDVIQAAIDPRIKRSMTHERRSPTIIVRIASRRQGARLLGAACCAACRAIRSASPARACILLIALAAIFAP